MKGTIYLIHHLHKNGNYFKITYKIYQCIEKLNDFKKQCKIVNKFTNFKYVVI